MAEELAAEDRLKLARVIVRRAIQEALESIFSDPRFSGHRALGLEMMTARVLDSLERPATRNAVRILGGADVELVT